MKPFFDFTTKELRLFSRLNSPQKIQDFLDRIPINFEPQGDTYLSPRQVLLQNTAHCAEGAILAAVILWYHGQKPLLLDLVTTQDDDDHVVALFCKNGFWGAISKTNHAVLRYREPIYKTVRELAISYFHEYFKDNGKKTLRTYSKPFNLAQIKDRSWLTSSENLWHVIDALDDSPHQPFLTKVQIKNLRKADSIEIKAGKIVEWQPPKKT